MVKVGRMYGMMAGLQEEEKLKRKERGGGGEEEEGGGKGKSRG